jgi:hypothetical protein
VKSVVKTLIYNFENAIRKTAYLDGSRETGLFENIKVTNLK